MNQKNLFSIIAAVLVLQGLAFYFMGDQLMSSAFPNADEAGHNSLKLLFEVVAAFSMLLGLVTYAARTSPSVVWAYAIGTLVLLLVTFKHFLVDGINVPLPAIIIQVLMFLAFVYLWSQQKRPVVVA
jgi:hypothetical protein